MRFPSPDDELLLAAIRDPTQLPEPVQSNAERVLTHAEMHGLGGVVGDTLRSAGVDEAGAANVARRQLARDLDHAAHLALLRRIDAAFASDRLRAVALKGVLFAERYYPRPAARGTTDIDVMVNESDLEPAMRALRTIGYRAWASPREARFRREHHHLHLLHPSAPELELHFHAYRGFGAVLPSEPLVARAAPAPRDLGFSAIRVLTPPDELVYLAVHAAGHRFGRLAWLYDLRLLLEAMSEAEILEAAERAREWRFGRVVAFAARLAAELLGVSSSRVAPLGRLGAVRSRVVRGIVGEPAEPTLRSATRFAYTAALCAGPTRALRYSYEACFGRARSMLGP